MTIEANYDVIRFIEHGSRCRPSMDRASGELLIYLLRQQPQTSKSMVFAWMRRLAVQLEQYRRCRNNRGYRYVNPYSVLVTRGGEVLLLDLEAESNEFVLKSMQKRTMRNHFVKPIIDIRENTGLSYDLYGFGKTMQFILANTEIDPPLKKWEEFRLEKVIRRCLGEDPRKQYEDLKQVLKDLPVEKPGVQREWKRVTCGVLVLLCFAATSAAFFIKNNSLEKEKQLMDEQLQRCEKELLEIKKAEQENDAQEEQSLTLQNRLELLAADVDSLGEYAGEADIKSSGSVIRKGELLRRELYWYLAAAYEQEGKADQAMDAYGDLCDFETEENLLERAYLKKAALELEHDQAENAAETIQEAAKQLPEIESSAEYQMLKAQCSLNNETENNLENSP